MEVTVHELAQIMRRLPTPHSVTGDHFRTEIRVPVTTSVGPGKSMEISQSRVINWRKIKTRHGHLVWALDLKC